MFSYSVIAQLNDNFMVCHQMFQLALCL